MPAPFLPLRAQVGTPQRRPSKTPSDKRTQNINGAQLTKPTSDVRVPFAGRLGRIALRYCTGAVFFPSAISCLTLSVASNRSREFGPCAPARRRVPDVRNGDLMINDAGKHQVKKRRATVREPSPLHRAASGCAQLALHRRGKKAATSLGKDINAL